MQAKPVGEDTPIFVNLACGVRGFLRECYRALSWGGIRRIVVTDLQAIMDRYQWAVRELSKNDQDEETVARHEQVIFRLFDQMVSTEAEGQSKQKRWVAGIERWVRGGPGKIGELHRWMYDQFSLSRLLGEAGFTRIKRTNLL